MSGLTIIDVAIGLIFTYLLLALICTAINELIAGLVSRRESSIWNSKIARSAQLG